MKHQRRTATARRASTRGGGTQAATAEFVATLPIERIAAGGDGVGHVDGMVCFVPRSAPGDTVHIAARRAARHVRGRVLQVLSPSPDRVEARCRHYEGDRCGGCQLQHLSAERQADARVAIVHDAIQRIGKRVVDRPTITSGAQWAYRGRLTLTVVQRGTRAIGGLHPYDDATRVFALDECPIAHSGLVTTWHAVRAQLQALPKASSGELRVSIRLLEGRQALVSVVVVGGTVWESAHEWAAVLAQRDAHVASVWWQREGGDRRALFVAPLFNDADEHSSEPDAFAFAQVHREVAMVLRFRVADELRRLHPAGVIDAYAGSGQLSEAAAREGVPVIVIESEVASTADASRRFAGMAHVQIRSDTVERALPHALAVTPVHDVVVLNPPRRGVDARVTSALEASVTAGVRAIVYVSCDPATLARDLTRLPSWRVDTVACFDMFPQTAHVETVCVLVPGGV